jgi:transposase
LVSIDRRQLVMRTIDVERLIEDEHSARLIWELVRRLDLSLYHDRIAAVKGHAGREHTDPQLLISLWLYAYSRGVSSARELARQCEYEPGCQWLCGLLPISHRTLSGFRSECKRALDDLFVQVLGMMSAEGLITLERDCEAIRSSISLETLALPGGRASRHSCPAKTTRPWSNIGGRPGGFSWAVFLVLVSSAAVRYSLATASASSLCHQRLARRSILRSQFFNAAGSSDSLLIPNFGYHFLALSESLYPASPVDRHYWTALEEKS